MPEPYPYIYVNSDGTARELHPDERRYLETEFKGGDGAAPHIKFSYDERDGWGDLRGFMKRNLLPDGMAVAAAPAENPNPPMNREEFIAWLRAKGVEVIEKDDGSFMVKPRPRGLTRQ
jgi:hypothetical protein